MLCVCSKYLKVSQDIRQYMTICGNMWQYMTISDVVKLQVLGLRLGVDFTFTLDNNDNHNNDNNPHLNFFKGTVLAVKEQGLEIRDKR